MDLYPAIDIRDGEAVRLAQGDFARQSVYGDPMDLARRFVAAGARWLHVVDLDAARGGRPVNRPTVLAIAGAAGVPVETGGGVRTDGDVEELLAGGVARVVLGTAAVDDPGHARSLSARYPGRVAVGIDYRTAPGGRREVASRGWEEGSGRSIEELLDELAGAALAAVVVTAIERDGMLAGPDLDGLARVLETTDVPVIASGGVADSADVRRLAGLSVPVGDAAPGGAREERRLSGVITGKALVDGRMTVEEGVAACALSG
jgi:phosphoribosylformimino-5-aminoimidazole carboxamide ribotide isomerase